MLVSRIESTILEGGTQEHELSNKERSRTGITASAFRLGTVTATSTALAMQS